MSYGLFMAPGITQRAQKGFAIVSAIFLLVALAALGAFMVSFSNTQHLTSAQDVQGSRAYWAAKGGVQWAAGVIAATNLCPAIQQPAFADGFNVVVGCQRFEYVEGVATRAIYWLQSTASTGGPVGSASYIERQVQAFVE